MIAERVTRAVAIAEARGDAHDHATWSPIVQLAIAATIAKQRGLRGFVRLAELRARSTTTPQLALPGMPADTRVDPATFDAAMAALLDGWEPTPDDVGLAHEVLVASSGERRAKGAHYTPRAVAERVVELTLAPLDGRLRVIDLACGGGAFLLAALRYARARGLDVELFGIDLDPLAALACRLSLQLERGAGGAAGVRVDAGDALGSPELLTRAPFDAVVGNPPWVSYAGRASQPLPPSTRARYAAFAAFAGFRNLQALFVERGAAVLRPGGRLGLVLPTSMSDLAGYAPSRRAHDAWCEVDDALIDLADGGFEGVFQPCMALTSTRRDAPTEAPPTAPWPLERNDLDDASRAFLAHVGALPKLPPALFGERGYQSLPSDKAQLRAEPFDGAVPLLTGTEVRPFERRPPRTFVDPSLLAQSLRPPAEYAEVDALIRQTARVPMVAAADGAAFRNSALAGFARAPYSRGLLIAWLNSWPVRAFHYLAHRDARQGMPQLKIGHLRDLPAPVDHQAIAGIDALGQALARANAGISSDDQQRLDALAARALGLDDAAIAVVERVRVLASR